MSLFPSEPFEHYLAMWNSGDAATRRHHLERAVTADVIFCDPANHHVGIDALEHNATELNAAEPDFEFEIASGFDHHHDRYRYRWRVVKHGETVLEGMDVTTVDEQGLLQRIDGFFGPIPGRPDQTG